MALSKIINGGVGASALPSGGCVASCKQHNDLLAKLCWHS